MLSSAVQLLSIKFHFIRARTINNESSKDPLFQGKPTFPKKHNALQMNNPYERFDYDKHIDEGIHNESVLHNGEWNVSCPRFSNSSVKSTVSEITEALQISINNITGLSRNISDAILHGSGLQKDGSNAMPIGECDRTSPHMKENNDVTEKRRATTEMSSYVLMIQASHTPHSKQQDQTVR